LWAGTLASRRRWMTTRLTAKTWAQVVRASLFVGAISTIGFSIAEFVLRDALTGVRTWPHAGRTAVFSTVFFIRIISAIVIIVTVEFARYTSLVFAPKIATRAGLEFACCRLVGLVGTVRCAIADPGSLDALRPIGTTELILEASGVVLCAGSIFIAEISAVVNAIALFGNVETLTSIQTLEDGAIASVARYILAGAISLVRSIGTVGDVIASLIFRYARDRVPFVLIALPLIRFAPRMRTVLFVFSTSAVSTAVTFPFHANAVAIITAEFALCANRLTELIDSCRHDRWSWPGAWRATACMA
jgi:hypothetical protein